MKKVTSMGWWSILKTFIRYGAYIMIVFEGLNGIMAAIETKDGITQKTD